MTFLQLVAHLFLLLLWTRLWVRPQQEFYFNPFLSGPTRLMDTIIGFLRPALMLPERMTALVLLLLFWAFQAVFFIRFGNTTWQLFGQAPLTPSDESLSWVVRLAYSGLRTAQFLLRVWTIYFFVRLIPPPPTRVTRAQEVFTFCTRPFSWLPLLVQPLVLFALYFALVFAATRTGSVIHFVRGEQSIPGIVVDGTVWAQFLKIGTLALMSFIAGLQMLIHVLIFLVLGGLTATIFGAQLFRAICNESVDALLGRFARKLVFAGGFDCTPLVAIIVLDVLSSAILVSLIKFLLSQ